MSASMKWRCLGHLQLLSKALAVMAKIEVSPQQEDMANPQGMEVFAVERPGLPEDIVLFPALCGVQSIVATRICSESANCLRSATYSVRRRGRHCA